MNYLVVMYNLFSKRLFIKIRDSIKGGLRLFSQSTLTKLSSRKLDVLDFLVVILAFSVKQMDDLRRQSYLARVMPFYFLAVGEKESRALVRFPAALKLFPYCRPTGWCGSDDRWPENSGQNDIGCANRQNRSAG